MSATRCEECGSALYGTTTAPHDDRKMITSNADVFRLCQRMGTLKQETFRVLALDVRHRLIKSRTIAIGSLSACPVDPREVFRFLIGVAAHATVLVHNHPSGDPSPSELDRELTARLRDAGKLVGINVLDHIIIARHGHYSFLAAEQSS